MTNLLLAYESSVKGEKIAGPLLHGNIEANSKTLHNMWFTPYHIGSHVSAGTNPVLFTTPTPTKIVRSEGILHR